MVFHKKELAKPAEPLGVAGVGQQPGTAKGIGGGSSGLQALGSTKDGVSRLQKLSPRPLTQAAPDVSPHPEPPCGSLAVIAFLTLVLSGGKMSKDRGGVATPNTMVGGVRPWVGDMEARSSAPHPLWAGYPENSPKSFLLIPK